MLRDEASIISEPVKAIEKEALVTCKDKQWSGMVDILGLASVIHTNIWSVYPDCNSNVRPLISGIVEPLFQEMEIWTTHMGDRLNQIMLSLLYINLHIQMK